VLRVYIEHYDRHRPHRALRLEPPAPPGDPDAADGARRGGCRRAAWTNFRTPRVSAGSRATGRCRRSSLCPPVTSTLFHRHAMLHESHERTNGRPTVQWSRREAGRSGRPRPQVL